MWKCAYFQSGILEQNKMSSKLWKGTRQQSHLFCMSGWNNPLPIGQSSMSHSEVVGKRFSRSRPLPGAIAQGSWAREPHSGVHIRYHDQTPGVGDLEAPYNSPSHLQARILCFFPPTSPRYYIAPSLSQGYIGGNDPMWQGQRYCPNASASGLMQEVDSKEGIGRMVFFWFSHIYVSSRVFILFRSSNYLNVFGWLWKIGWYVKDMHG